MAKIVRAGAAFDDPKVSPVVRQTLLHWGYELSSSDFEVEAARYRKTGVPRAGGEAQGGGQGGEETERRQR